MIWLAINKKQLLFSRKFGMQYMVDFFCLYNGSENVISILHTHRVFSTCLWKPLNYRHLLQFNITINLYSKSLLVNTEKFSVQPTFSNLTKWPISNSFNLFLISLRTYQHCLFKCQLKKSIGSISNKIYIRSLVWHKATSVGHLEFSMQL